MATMTLREYLEYTEVYEYSQENYDINKEIMELDLISMHMESYNFIQNNRFSINQMNQLMIESTDNKQIEEIERMYVEKSEGVLSKIGAIFKKIGSAIVSFFKKIGNWFTGNSDHLDELEKENKELRKEIEEIEKRVNKIDDKKSDKKSKKLPNSEDNEDIEHDLQRAEILDPKSYKDRCEKAYPIIKASIREAFNKIHDIELHANGAIMMPVLDDSVRSEKGEISNMVEKLNRPGYPQFEQNSETERLCKLCDVIVQYPQKINTPAIIPHFSDMMKNIRNVLSLKGDNAEKFTYQYMMRIHESNGKSFANFSNKIQKLREGIDKALHTVGPKKFNKEELTKISAQADEFNKLMNEIYNHTNLDTESDTYSAKIDTIERDINKRMEGDSTYDKNKFNKNKTNKRLKADDNKKEFLRQYPMYMKDLNNLAKTLMDMSNLVIKSISNYKAIREIIEKTAKDINAQERYISGKEE